MLKKNENKFKFKFGCHGTYQVKTKELWQVYCVLSDTSTRAKLKATQAKVNSTIIKDSNNDEEAPFSRQKGRL